MSSKEKLVARFLTLPSDFTFDELELHKPHPGNIVKQYAVRQVLEELQSKGHIK